MSEDVIIRSAEQKDILEILEVQKDSLLKNKTIRSAEKDGFIIYSISEDELRGLISSNCCFLIVAVHQDKVVGYALAYDLNVWRKIKTKWDKRSLVTNSVKNHLIMDKVLYFRHIVRDNSFKGVGARLEEEIYSIAKKKGFEYVIAEILESPLKNKKSIEIHEKRGYAKIGYLDYLDGYFWRLYEKKLE